MLSLEGCFPLWQSQETILNYTGNSKTSILVDLIIIILWKCMKSFFRSYLFKPYCMQMLSHFIFPSFWKNFIGSSAYKTRNLV